MTAVLHQMHMSGNCYKVRLAAAQLGVPIALEEYPLHGGKTRTPEYLAKNPDGRVPMLELDDGRKLPQSNAIIWYLSEGSKLQPADAWGRAQALQWMFFEQYSHEPYIAVARFIKGYGTPQMKEQRAKDFPVLMEKGNAALGVMERHLATQDWFAGDAYSVADISLFGYTHAAEEGGFELAKFPAVSAWLKRVEATPGYIPLSKSW